jgi:hypothetical protein
MSDEDVSAFGSDDTDRKQMDPTVNTVTAGSAAGMGVGPGIDQRRESPIVLSAIFDSDGEALCAVSELRKIGVGDADLSLIAQSKGTMTTREGSGEIADEEHANILRGILGGGALGAGLGVVALAIPGVGPLAALGAIAASAVPEAIAIGAVAGAAAGTFNEALKRHGVGDEDAAYYSDRLKSGGVLVTASVEAATVERAHEILHRNGGHSAAHARDPAI